MSQPTRHPQEPELTSEEIQHRIALVRAAKVASGDSLTSADLDLVLAPGGSELTRRQWAEANRTRQADQKRVWRARNRDKVAAYISARKVGRLGKQAP